MPHASHVGPATAGAASSTASSGAADFAAAAFFCGSTRYFLAQSSHRWTSSYRSSPNTSVMCKVAVFGHRWHFIADPLREVHSTSVDDRCHCHPLRGRGRRRHGIEKTREEKTEDRAGAGARKDKRPRMDPLASF